VVVLRPMPVGGGGAQRLRRPPRPPRRSRPRSTRRCRRRSRRRERWAAPPRSAAGTKCGSGRV